MSILRRIILGAAGSIDMHLAAAAPGDKRDIPDIGPVDAVGRGGQASGAPATAAPLLRPLQVVIGSECWGACARTDPHAIMPQCCNKVGAKMAITPLPRRPPPQPPLQQA